MRSSFKYLCGTILAVMAFFQTTVTEAHILSNSEEWSIGKQASLKYESINDCVEDNDLEEIYQDILNSLYSDKIIAIDEQKYNFNSRHYIFYKNKSKQNLKMERFLKEIVILHFSGRIKPWENNYRGNFQKIYSHYERRIVK